MVTVSELKSLAKQKAKGLIIGAKNRAESTVNFLKTPEGKKRMAFMGIIATASAGGKIVATATGLALPATVLAGGIGALAGGVQGAAGKFREIKEKEKSGEVITGLQKTKLIGRAAALSALSRGATAAGVVFVGTTPLGWIGGTGAAGLAGAARGAYAGLKSAKAAGKTGKEKAKEVIKQASQNAVIGASAYLVGHGVGALAQGHGLSFGGGARGNVASAVDHVDGPPTRFDLGGSGETGEGEMPSLATDVIPPNLDDLQLDSANYDEINQDVLANFTSGGNDYHYHINIDIPLDANGQMDANFLAKLQEIGVNYTSATYTQPEVLQIGETYSANQFDGMIDTNNGLAFDSNLVGGGAETQLTVMQSGEDGKIYLAAPDGTPMLELAANTQLSPGGDLVSDEKWDFSNVDKTKLLDFLQQSGLAKDEIAKALADGDLRAVWDDVNNNYTFSAEDTQELLDLAAQNGGGGAGADGASPNGASGTPTDTPSGETTPTPSETPTATPSSSTLAPTTSATGGASSVAPDTSTTLGGGETGGVSSSTAPGAVASTTPGGNKTGGLDGDGLAQDKSFNGLSVIGGVLGVAALGGGIWQNIAANEYIKKREEFVEKIFVRNLNATNPMAIEDAQTNLNKYHGKFVLPPTKFVRGLKRYDKTIEGRVAHFQKDEIDVNSRIATRLSASGETASDFVNSLSGDARRFLKNDGGKVVLNDVGRADLYDYIVNRKHIKKFTAEKSEGYINTLLERHAATKSAPDVAPTAKTESDRINEEIKNLNILDRDEILAFRGYKFNDRDELVLSSTPDGDPEVLATEDQLRQLSAIFADNVELNKVRDEIRRTNAPMTDDAARTDADAISDEERARIINEFNSAYGTEFTRVREEMATSSAGGQAVFEDARAKLDKWLNERSNELLRKDGIFIPDSVVDFDAEVTRQIYYDALRLGVDKVLNDAIFTGDNSYDDILDSPYIDRVSASHSGRAGFNSEGDTWMRDYVLTHGNYSVESVIAALREAITSKPTPEEDTSNIEKVLKRTDLAADEADVASR